MGTGARTAAWLLAVFTFLIVYGSLFPFRFADIGAGGAAELLGRLPWGRTTRSDIAANLLLYLPFGACLAWLLASRLGGLLAVLVTTLVGALLSLGIELIQLYETRRVASLTDVAANSLGALLGAVLALAVGAAQRRLGGGRLALVLQHPVAAALVLSWLGYRLSPFAPAFDLAEWLASIRVLGGGGLELRALPVQLLAWLLLLQACMVLTPRGRPLPTLITLMLVVLGGRILFAGLSLQAAELAAMALALALARPMEWLGSQRAAALLAGALVVLLAVQGLAPFNFQVTGDAFGLAPFAESLTTYRAANLPETFLRCFTSGGLVWLLVRGGLPVLAATVTAASLVFAIEALQIWLPGRTADITDPLLAVAAGGLIALFESGVRRRPG